MCVSFFSWLYRGVHNIIFISICVNINWYIALSFKFGYTFYLQWQFNSLKCIIKFVLYLLTRSEWSLRLIGCKAGKIDQRKYFLSLFLTFTQACFFFIYLVNLCMMLHLMEHTYWFSVVHSWCYLGPILNHY